MVAGAPGRPGRLALRRAASGPEAALETAIDRRCPTEALTAWGMGRGRGRANWQNARV